MTFSEVWIENGPDCSYDFVEIEFENRQPVRLCTSPEWQSNRQALATHAGLSPATLRFASDESVGGIDGQGGGFHLTFSGKFNRVQKSPCIIFSCSSMTSLLRPTQPAVMMRW